MSAYDKRLTVDHIRYEVMVDHLFKSLFKLSISQQAIEVSANLHNKVTKSTPIIDSYPENCRTVLTKDSSLRRKGPERAPRAKCRCRQSLRYPKTHLFGTKVTMLTTHFVL